MVSAPIAKPEPVGVDPRHDQAVVDRRGSGSVPMMKPTTEPMPPVSAVPPITAAAIACSSRPSPERGQRRLEPEGRDHAGEAGEQRAQHEAEQLHPPGVDAHVVGRLAAGRRWRRSSCRDWRRCSMTPRITANAAIPEHRGAEQAEVGDEHADRHVGREGRRKAARQHGRERAGDEQHAERGDEARDAEGAA